MHAGLFLYICAGLKKYARRRLCAFSPGGPLSARLCPYLGLFGKGPPRVVILAELSAHVVVLICVPLLAAVWAPFLVQSGPVVCGPPWRVMRFAAGHCNMPPVLWQVPLFGWHCARVMWSYQLLFNY
jgi:hypothetical protein